MWFRRKTAAVVGIEPSDQYVAPQMALDKLTVTQKGTDNTATVDPSEIPPKQDTNPDWCGQSQPHNPHTWAPRNMSLPVIYRDCAGHS